MSRDIDEQWCFDPSSFQNTPSRALDNMSAQHELKARNDGVHFMLRSGNALKLKSNVLSSATTYFHRFYLRYSIGPSGYDKIPVAAACLFLASKVEESTRKLRDVAQVCYAKYTNDQTMKDAEKWMPRILTHEAVLLEALCFDLIVTHPHEFISDVFGAGTRDSEKWKWHGRLAKQELLETGLYQLTWAVANDSLRLPLCLFYSPHVIACAAYLISVVAIHAKADGSRHPNASGSPNPSRTPAEGSQTGPSDATGGPSATVPGENASTRDTATEPEVQDRVSGRGLDSSISLDATGHVEVPTSLAFASLTFDDILARREGTGEWIEAFGVDDTSFKDLRDVIGNILELYNLGDSPPVVELRKLPPPKLYESLTGITHTGIPPQIAATSNSSPALTLASNATPMHRAGDDSSQEYSTLADDDTRPRTSDASAATDHSHGAFSLNVDSDSIMNLVD